MSAHPCRFACVFFVVTSAGCAATNPCDPASPADVQAKGTRIAGTVVDQSGAHVAGVTVSIAGRAETAVSGSDGAFAFSDLPPAASYQIVASPAAPLVGGRVTTAALTCGAQLDAVDVAVVVPPASPEVEIVQASGSARMFAAFGASGSAPDVDVTGFYDDSSGGDHKSAGDVIGACNALSNSAPVAYRVQVRAPFQEWTDAVLSTFPWIDTPGGAVPDAAYTDRVEDTCAKAMCTQFEYLEATLHNPQARCADVVGTRTPDGAVVGLEPFGTYQVRVLAEVHTDAALRKKFTLPDRVLAAPAETAGQMSLVPGALLPVVGADGQPKNVGNITSLASTAGGRFAFVEDDALNVVGDGADTLSSSAQSAVGATDAPQGAFGEDGDASANLTSQFGGDDNAGALGAKPLAVLAAGDWVRVMRRLDDGSSSVEKVYVGTSAGAAASGPSPTDAADNAEHPALRMDPTSQSAGTALRAFTYLAPGANRVDDVSAEPKDAYVLLYGTAFVLVEQGARADLALHYFADDAALAANGDILDTAWAGSADDASDDAAFGGACGRLSGDANAAPESVDDNPGVVNRVNVSVCYDVGNALGDDVDLRDVKVFDTGATFGAGPRAVFSDAAGDRVLVATLDALTCAACSNANATPLATSIESVRVGREPLGMLTTRALVCGVDTVFAPLVLVANHGSGDVSVVGDSGAGLVEEGAIPMPSAPVGFLDDAGGANCDDPFVWAIGDDGSIMPIDMRSLDHLPTCNGAACGVSTHGRGSVGAIARGAGSSRALVGGDGVLGELGFFRPKALPGAAYESGADLGTGVASDPPSP